MKRNALRTEQNTLWPKRNALRMEQNVFGKERNVSGTERFVFLGRNALYAFTSFSIFSDIHISSHGKSAFCLSSLRQNEKKIIWFNYIHLFVCNFLWIIKGQVSVKIMNIITFFRQLFLNSENNDRHLGMFSVFKIVTLIHVLI